MLVNKKISLVIFAASALFVSVLLQSVTVNAAIADPGCYKKTVQVVEKLDHCAVVSHSSRIVPPYNECFISVDGATEVKVDCGAIYPGECNDLSGNSVDCGDKTIKYVAGSGCNADNGNCIVDDIQKLVDFLAVGVGIVITLVIVVGGIQYSVSRDNAQAVQAAKLRILNALIALLAFLFLYAFLQWLLPGDSVILPGL